MRGLKFRGGIREIAQSRSVNIEEDLIRQWDERQNMIGIQKLNYNTYTKNAKFPSLLLLTPTQGLIKRQPLNTNRNKERKSSQR